MSKVKVYIPNISRTDIGGGWTFLANLIKSEKHMDAIQFVEDEASADILLAFAPTTVDGETIERFKKQGKKFILRMDGVPEDNRNSGKGTRRMIEYASKADLIIYQTNFVKETVGRILKMNGVNTRERVIMNGVDTDVFTSEGDKMRFEGGIKIAHMAFRKDNNKRYEEVVQFYREIWTHRQDVNLILIGRYPTEWEQYNMGFFNGERFKRMGIVQDDAYKSMLLRSCDVFFYPSYADPAPNAVLEAMACGLPIIYQSYGGVAEMVPNSGHGNFPIGSSSYMDLLESAVDKDKSRPNRKYALEHYSLPMMAVRYEEAIIDTIHI